MSILLLPFGVGFDMVGVIQNDATFFNRVDMLLVRVLIEGQQYIRLVSGASNFAGTDAHLENRRTTGNGGGNGHEGHDFLLAAPGKPGQESANGLYSVLRVTRNPDNGLVDSGDVGSAFGKIGAWRGVTHSVFLSISQLAQS